MSLLFIALICSAAAPALVAISKLLLLLLRAYNARCRLLKSPIPGPPVPSKILGRKCCCTWQPEFSRSRPSGPSNTATPPLPHPPTGHVPDCLGPKSIWTAVDWANTYGPIYKIQMLDMFCIVVTDPDSLATITRRTSWVPIAEQGLLPVPQRPVTQAHCGMLGLRQWGCVDTTHMHSPSVFLSLTYSLTHP